MSTSYRVFALREEDKDFKVHMAVLEACRRAEVDLPKQTQEYFGDAADYEKPEDVRNAALEVDITDKITEWSGDGHTDRIVLLELLPKSVKTIVFRVSW